MRQERERRFFDLKRRQNGWFSCEGNLDPEGGTLLETALGAIAGEQKCEGDHRSPGQARADALSGLAEHRLAFGDLPEKGQEKPHLTIVVSAETLRGDEHSPAPQIDWGTPVSGETAKRDRLRRHRAYRGGRGPWGRDRGRSAHGAAPFRTTTVAQRKALELQDGGCIWCGKHPRSCTPHHWEAWSEGGGTDHENLGLVCGVHHFAFHEGGYRTAEVSPNRVVILSPDGRCTARCPATAGTGSGSATVRNAARERDPSSKTRRGRAARAVDDACVSTL